MPLLSFVVVAHREQAYLEGCAEALLGRPTSSSSPSTTRRPATAPSSSTRSPRATSACTCSTSASAAASVLAAPPAWRTHGRLRVVRPCARPAGARRGRRGGGAAADARPDILLVGHARVDALGRERPGPLRGLLGRVAGDGTTTLDRRPGLVAAAPRASTRSSGARRSTRSGPASRTASRPSCGRRCSPRNGSRPRRRPGCCARAAQRAGTEGRRRVRGLRRGLRLPRRRVPRCPDARRRLVLPAIVRRELARARAPPRRRRRRTSTRCRPSGSATGAATGPRRRAAWRGWTHGSWTAATCSATGPCTRRSSGARRSRRRRRTLARRGRRALAAARRKEIQRHYRARLEPAGRPRPRRLRRLLVPRLRVQPARDLREGARARPALRGVWVVSRERRRHPAGRRARRPGHPRVLRRASPARSTSSTTSTSRTTW